jgi:hypothetical protein
LIGTPAKIASSMAGRPSFVPGILMKRFGASRGRRAPWPQRGCLRVVREEGRHLQRDPAVHRVRPVPDRPEDVGRAREVLEREVEEERLDGPAGLHTLADRVVVGGAVLDGLVEDGRVRGQPRHRKLLDVARDRPAAEQVSRDVVQPDALAQVVEKRSLSSRHLLNFRVASLVPEPDHRPGQVVFVA